MKKLVKITVSVIAISLISYFVYGYYQEQKAEQQRIEQEQKAEQQRIEQEQKAEQQRIEQEQKITKLFISQLNKKNINNLPLSESYPFSEQKYKINNNCIWQFYVNDKLLHTFIADLANKNIGKNKYNNKNSDLLIGIAYVGWADAYCLYDFSLELHRPNKEDFSVEKHYYYNLFEPNTFILNKEMMDNAGIVLW